MGLLSDAMLHIEFKRVDSGSVATCAKSVYLGAGECGDELFEVRCGEVVVDGHWQHLVLGVFV